MGQTSMEESGSPAASGSAAPRGRQVSAGLLFHTLRHLRPAQLIALARNRMRRFTDRPERHFASTTPPPEICHWQPRAEFLPPGPQDNLEASLLAGEFGFLQRVERVGFPPAWQVDDLPRLWQYNLHYFEYLWALPFDAARDLVVDWIEKHPLMRDACGWEPYPTSLRLMNWCGVFFARHADRTRAETRFRGSLWRSIHLQADWLHAHLETHIAANHLLENAMALSFCGSCFAGDSATRWKRAGTTLLREQLSEQIGADGMHYEASPMYQLRILYALAMLWNTGDDELTEWVDEPLGRMAAASAQLIHADGEIPLLGDSAMRVYHAPSRLLDWCQGLRDQEPRPLPLGCFSLPDVGYYGARTERGHFIVCDAGGIGPNHQPGHAHGDIFSFELALSGQRLICDTGVHDYEVGPRRDTARSTAAHNTVQIAGEDQAEFWSAFRVGRRGRARDVAYEASADGFRLSGWHDGYTRLPGHPRHRREFSWQHRGALTVLDRVESRREVDVVSRLHLHPSCRVTEYGETHAFVKLPGGGFWVVFGGPGRLEIREAPYYPAFGVELASSVLVYSTAGSDVTFGYSITEESLDDARSLSDALFPA